MRYSPLLMTLSHCALIAWERIVRTTRKNAGLKTHAEAGPSSSFSVVLKTIHGPSSSVSAVVNNHSISGSDFTIDGFRAYPNQPEQNLNFASETATTPITLLYTDG